MAFEQLGPGILSALVSYRNTLCNVIGVKRHIASRSSSTSVSISAAEINPTVRAVRTGVLYMLQFG